MLRNLFEGCGCDCCSSTAADASTAAQAPASEAAADQPTAAAAGNQGDFYTSNASTLSAGTTLEAHITQVGQH